MSAIFRVMLAILRLMSGICSCGVTQHANMHSSWAQVFDKRLTLLPSVSLQRHTSDRKSDLASIKMHICTEKKSLQKICAGRHGSDTSAV
uniref:Putative secreted protein n=1 Tax=Ixodes ricinus TaxID=34613 RepID=A0A6B0UD07_IXORI